MSTTDSEFSSSMAKQLFDDPPIVNKVPYVNTFGTCAKGALFWGAIGGIVVVIVIMLFYILLNIKIGFLDILARSLLGGLIAAIIVFGISIWYCNSTISTKNNSNKS